MKSTLMMLLHII